MALNQIKAKEPTGQFNYLGRWVDKAYFRAFVYNVNDETKLAENYDQFENLISSGLWFACKEDVLKFTDERNKNLENDNLNEDSAENLQNNDLLSSKNIKTKRFSKPTKNEG